MCTAAQTRVQKGCLMEYFSRASEDLAFLWTIWGLIKMQATQQHSALRNKSLLLASASPLKRLVEVSLCKLNHCTNLSSPDAFTEPVCFPKPARFLYQAAIKKCRISMFCTPEAHFIPCIFYNREKMWAKSSCSHACSACMQITCETFFVLCSSPCFALEIFLSPPVGVNLIHHELHCWSNCLQPSSNCKWGKIHNSQLRIWAGWLKYSKTLWKVQVSHRK